VLKYTATLLLIIIAALIFQQFLPVLSSWHEARILLLPTVFLCIAVTVPVPIMLLMAFICGFLWDAQHLLTHSSGDPHIYTDPVPTLRFGYSIILYAAMGFIMQGIQPLFKRGVWYLSILLAGIALFFYLIAEFALLTFVRGDFVFSSEIFFRILISAALTMPFSFLIFLILFKLAKLCKYQIRYEGLKRDSKLGFDLRYE